jgi:hypothetical protein
MLQLPPSDLFRRESQLTILQPTAASNWRFQRRAMTLRIYPPPFRTASFPIHSSPTSKPALARLTGGVPADTVITESHARKTDSRCKLRGTACSVPHSPSSPWRAPISKGCSIPHHEVHSVISGRRHNISKKISSWKKKLFFLNLFFLNPQNGSARCTHFFPFTSVKLYQRYFAPILTDTSHLRRQIPTTALPQVLSKEMSTPPPASHLPTILCYIQILPPLKQLDVKKIVTPSRQQQKNPEIKTPINL